MFKFLEIQVDIIIQLNPSLGVRSLNVTAERTQNLFTEALHNKLMV